MNDFTWAAVPAALIALLMFLAILWWMPRGGTGKSASMTIRRMTVILEPARVDEERVTERLWSVPIIFKNMQRSPVPIPTMAARAQFETTQRAPRSFRRYEYFGEFHFELAGVQFEDGSTVMLNPREERLGYALIALPEEMTPATVQLWGWDPITNALTGGYQGTVTVPDELKSAQNGTSTASGVKPNKRSRK